MPTIRLPTGIVSFDLPTEAQLVPENGPMFGYLDFGQDRYVFYILQVVDLSGYGDIVDGTLDLVLDDDEWIESELTDRSDIFEETISIAVDLEDGGRRGRYFFRADHMGGSTVRILKISPGRSDGDDIGTRSALDDLGRIIAEGVRFSDVPTPIDRAAGIPGSTVLAIPDRFICPLPTGWTVHEMDEFEPDWEPEPGSDQAVVCLGPDERVSMYVSAENLVRHDPASARELAEDISEMWEQDCCYIAGMDDMGVTIECPAPDQGRYLVRGDFDPAKLGTEGRHYLLRAIGPRQMVTVQMTPILIDPDDGTAACRQLLDPLDACIRRAHVFLKGD